MSLQSFTLFPELPSELRLKIWKEACYITRVLDLHPVSALSAHNVMSFRTRSRNPPSIFHICHEARIVALKHYQLYFGTHSMRGLGGGPLHLSKDPKMWVNWASDIIYPVFQPPNPNISFILRLLSRVPFTRIAIQNDHVFSFQGYFGHELAWNGHGREIIIFPVLDTIDDQRLMSFEFNPLDAGNATLENSVRFLEEKINMYRERCPALVSPTLPIITCMILKSEVLP